MTQQSGLSAANSRRNAWWIVPLLLAMAFAVYIYFFMPHEREIDSLGVLLFKLVPFFLASFSIAWFPQKAPTWLKVLLVFATLFPFLGFLVPRELHLAIEGLETGMGLYPTDDPAPVLAVFGEFYTTMAIMVPYVILMLAFAYRCGGGNASNSLKIAWSGILFMLSGFEDVMFWVVNARGPIPEIASWAHHVTVFLGRAATRTELYLFMVVHFVLIAVVFVLPLGRIGTWLAQRFRRAPSPQTDDGG